LEELIEHWLGVFRERYGAVDAVFDNAALGCLLDYSWPGNVRELRNAIECAVLMARGARITLNELPLELRACASPLEVVTRTPSLAVEQPREKLRSLEIAESEAIRTAIQHSNGNLTRAAAELGIAKSTLYTKMSKYALKRESIARRRSIR
jgi:DNA-binding NtrC family response regulator